MRREPARYTYITGVDLFAQHLELFRRLREEGYGFLPQISFDDGHISNAEIAAPMLESCGMTAHFFVTVGWTGTRAGYMGWDEVRSLARGGHTVGAHGWSHTLLTNCTSSQLETELVRSRLMLEDKLGIEVATMSLPGGRCNRRVLTACGAAGYRHIFTSVPRAEPTPLPATVGRLNILGNMEPEWLAKALDPASGLLAALERKQRWKDRAKSLLGDRLYARVWAMVNRQEAEDAAA